MNQPQEQPQPYVAPAAPAQQYAPPPQPQAPPPVPPPPATQGQAPFPQQQQHAPQQYARQPVSPPQGSQQQQGYPPPPYPPQYAQPQHPQQPGYPPQYYPHPNAQQPYLVAAPQKPKDKVRQRILIANAIIICLVLAFFLTRAPAPQEGQSFAVDGKSNLSSNAASVEYPVEAAVGELVEPRGNGEVWSAFTKDSGPGSWVELWDRPDAKYADSTAINRFVAEKSIEISESAGQNITPKIVSVDGKRGYLWRFRELGISADYVSLWVPGATGTIRLKCKIRPDELERARALCDQAIESLKIS